ncbi:hypothetical protein F5884DRAFT_864199 [Xylogone sp. PMI_703]|nr:hypothetical protein F5884DRAFT_864199 [Xylogone sp. PMI_703]
MGWDGYQSVAGFNPNVEGVTFLKGPSHFISAARVDNKTSTISLSSMSPLPTSQFPLTVTTTHHGSSETPLIGAQFNQDYTHQMIQFPNVRASTPIGTTVSDNTGRVQDKSATEGVKSFGLEQLASYNASASLEEPATSSNGNDNLRLSSNFSNENVVPSEQTPLPFAEDEGVNRDGGSATCSESPVIKKTRSSAIKKGAKMRIKKRR